MTRQNTLALLAGVAFLAACGEKKAECVTDVGSALLFMQACVGEHSLADCRDALDDVGRRCGHAERARVARKWCDARLSAGCEVAAKAYLDGDGVARNVALARTFTARAHECAESDCLAGRHTLQCSRVALDRKLGRGVARDKGLASKLAESGCAAGDALSCDAYGGLAGEQAQLKLANTALRRLIRACPIAVRQPGRGASCSASLASNAPLLVLLDAVDAEAKTLASRWLEGACEQAVDSACEGFLRIVASAEIGPPDPERLRRAYRKDAAQLSDRCVHIDVPLATQGRAEGRPRGDADACARLGRIYRSGWLGPVNPALSARVLLGAERRRQKECHANDTLACVALLDQATNQETVSSAPAELAALKRELTQQAACDDPMRRDALLCIRLEELP